MHWGSFFIGVAATLITIALVAYIAVVWFDARKDFEFGIGVDQEGGQ